VVWAARCYRSAISLSWKNSECQLTKARAHLNLSMELSSITHLCDHPRATIMIHGSNSPHLREAERPFKRSSCLSGAHGMTRAAQCMSWPVRLLLFEHPVQSHRQFARHHYFADAGVLFFAAQALVGTP